MTENIRQKNSYILFYLCFLSLFSIIPKLSIASDSGVQSSGDKDGGVADTQEVAVDLDAMDEEDLEPAPAMGHPGSEQGSQKPNALKIKLFFDLLVEYEWERNKFQFSSDHAYIMFELDIVSWLSFRTDVSIDPEFFEIVLTLGNYTEIRLGKVLVPFGQNSFHSLVGGRVDEQSLFMPIIWSDYGLVLKQIVYDGSFLGFDVSLWCGNGFGESVGLSGDPEPTSRAGRLADNNMMKGVGIRPVVHLGTHIALGTSWYLDKWSTEDRSYMLYYGADIDLGYGLIPTVFLKDIRLRGEIAWGEIQLPEKNFYSGLIDYGIRRSGYYAELSYRPLRWLVLRYREGYLNADSRFTDTGDILIHEPAVKLIFGPLQTEIGVQLHQILPDPPYEDEPKDTSYAYVRLFLRY